MTKSEFVYVTYIMATQQQVWDALTKGEFTRKYWEADNVSDWKPGSKWEHRGSEESHPLKIVGNVVEYDAPRRLVLTWAAPADVANQAAHSRVTLELEQVDEMVRLTVRHGDLPADSDMLRGITAGWPRVLSSLKSLLETGKPLPTWSKVKS
jgi:uncharacterized protein YndB with AHSA1/START domain